MKTNHFHGTQNNPSLLEKIDLGYRISEQRATQHNGISLSDAIVDDVALTDFACHLPSRSNARDFDFWSEPSAPFIIAHTTPVPYSRQRGRPLVEGRAISWG